MDAPPVAHDQFILEGIPQARDSIADGWLAHGQADGRTVRFCFS